MKRIARFSRLRLIVAVLFGTAGSFIETCRSWNRLPPGNSHAEIEQIEKLITETSYLVPEFLKYPSFSLANIKSEKLSQLHLALNKIGVTETNRKTAYAKGLTNMILQPKSFPGDIPDPAWETREIDAREPWHYYDTSDRVLRAVPISVIAFVVCFVAGLLFTLSLSWLWYFTLDRLAEIFRAIRGTHNGPDV